MTHNTREGIEETLRKEYRQKTLQMAKEVSASGTYEKVEGMICDWWLGKFHQELQKARHDWLREEIVKLGEIRKSVLTSPDDEYAEDYSRRLNARNQMLIAIIDRYQSELDQPNT